MCLAQGPQRSEAGEAWTRGLSVSSQALYHWASALPKIPGKMGGHLAANAKLYRQVHSMENGSQNPSEIVNRFVTCKWAKSCDDISMSHSTADLGQV